MEDLTEIQKLSKLCSELFNELYSLALELESEEKYYEATIKNKKARMRVLCIELDRTDTLVLNLKLANNTISKDEYDQAIAENTKFRNSGYSLENA